MATKRKAKATKATARRALDPAAKIKVLVDNPYRDDSLGARVFAKYKSGQTVAAFEKAVGKVRGSKRSARQFLAFDVKQKHVSVG
jgi:hypothetical protein